MQQQMQPGPFFSSPPQSPSGDPYNQQLSSTFSPHTVGSPGGYGGIQHQPAPSPYQQQPIARSSYSPPPHCAGQHSPPGVNAGQQSPTGYLGQQQTGQTYPGQQPMGQTYAGQPQMGQTFAGQPQMGQPYPGQPQMGQTYPGQPPQQQPMSPPAGYGGIQMTPMIGGYPGQHMVYAGGQQMEPPPTQVMRAEC